MSTGAEALLDVHELAVAYGGIRAVSQVSLRVGPGQVVALLGPNGAGKTTTMKAVMGLLRSKSGSIVLDGKDVTGHAAHKRFHAGIALVPEGRGIVAPFSVEENLKLGSMHGRSGWTHEQVYELFPVLEERLQQAAGYLSGGEQQQLAVARALLGGPKILLLDEPTTGLAPVLVNRLFDSLRLLKERGTAMLIAEQNARQALNIADYVYVLERGRVTSEGPPQELGDEKTILEAYLRTGGAGKVAEIVVDSDAAAGSGDLPVAAEPHSSP
jgi:branched-chain amino acid transport system ATP-binding protein